MGGYLSHLKAEPLETVLNASCGPVKGNEYRHGDRSVHGYLGIPYAQPPVGPLRFKKPLPADIWTEPRDCTQYGPRCPPSGMLHEATDFMSQEIPDEANCLTLNVFQPSWQSKSFVSQRPVMVFIHGGGFELGSSRDYCAYSLANTLPLKDVVLVTINYRLGILGFFTTGDDVCRGNFGLWDQTLALQWVQKHIASFGGNPNNVTIFGQSAGGASVDLLSLSPHSRDLFHKVIPMSGCADTHFAMRTAKNEAKVCREFAEKKGFQGSGTAELVDFLKNLSAATISEKIGFQHTTSGLMTFCPNFDKDFFPKPLNELRKEAPKKTVMIGCVEHEGLIFAFTNPAFTNSVDELKRRIAIEFGDDMVENFEEVRQQIFEQYSRVDNGTTMEENLVQFVGDSMFNVGILLAAENCAKKGDDVYFYVFDYCNPDGFGQFTDLLPFKVPTHSTDLRYVLGEGVYSKFDPTEEELKMVDQMGDFYTNFAKFGNPNSPGSESAQWEKYDVSKRGRHFHISLPNSQMRNEYHNERCEFLTEIHKNNKSYLETFYRVVKK
uniref:Carboxylic ester hydrolase n=1 Tax=Caenorhabditis japonica TaxID=281687 RepID=A0A8R1HLS6_CAEJA